jgi:hypothetical protein
MLGTEAVAPAAQPSRGCFCTPRPSRCQLQVSMSNYPVSTLRKVLIHYLVSSNVVYLRFAPFARRVEERSQRGFLGEQANHSVGAEAEMFRSQPRISRASPLRFRPRLFHVLSSGWILRVHSDHFGRKPDPNVTHLHATL